MLSAVLSLALQEPEAGFEKIFNGRDLSGLKFHFMDPAFAAAKTFSVQDGALVCTGKPEGYWYTEKKYKNFTLRFDWRFKRPEDLEVDLKFQGNSGYMLWIAEIGSKAWPKTVECQGMNREAGKIYWNDVPKGKAEYDLALAKKTVKPVGQWNTYEIAAKIGGTVEVSVNGVKVATVLEHPFTEAGHIGFQVEGSEIHWKNIRIREDK